MSAPISQDDFFMSTVDRLNLVPKLAIHLKTHLSSSFFLLLIKLDPSWQEEWEPLVELLYNFPDGDLDRLRNSCTPVVLHRYLSHGEVWTILETFPDLKQYVSEELEDPNAVRCIFLDENGAGFYLVTVPLNDN